MMSQILAEKTHLLYRDVIRLLYARSDRQCIVLRMHENAPLLQ